MTLQLNQNHYLNNYNHYKFLFLLLIIINLKNLYFTNISCKQKKCVEHLYVVVQPKKIKNYNRHFINLKVYVFGKNVQVEPVTVRSVFSDPSLGLIESTFAV